MALKKKETLSFVTTWMNLEDVKWNKPVPYDLICNILKIELTAE
jgi:hypothetical protein